MTRRMFQTDGPPILGAKVTTVAVWATGRTGFVHPCTIWCKNRKYDRHLNNRHGELKAYTVLILFDTNTNNYFFKISLRVTFN
jgi:hypothetical protein